MEQPPQNKENRENINATFKLTPGTPGPDGKVICFYLQSNKPELDSAVSSLGGVMILDVYASPRIMGQENEEKAKKIAESRMEKLNNPENQKIIMELYKKAFELEKEQKNIRKEFFDLLGE